MPKAPKTPIAAVVSEALAPPAPKPTFSPQQAQALINTARSAPLKDMDHAGAVNRLLENFARWYESIANKPA